MPRPKEINGSAWVKFRTNKRVKSFLEEVAKDSGVTVSELCRGAVMDYFFARLLGGFKYPPLELRKRFFNKFAIETTASIGETGSQPEKQKQSESGKT